MKVLLYSCSSRRYPYPGTLLEEAKTLADAGNQVVFAYCSGVMNACSCNVFSTPIRCKVCQFGYRRILKPYPGIEYLPLKRVNETPRVFNYTDLDSLKRVVYRDVEIGYAVLSELISFSRDPEPNVAGPAKEGIDHLLNESANLVDCAIKLIDEIKPDMIAFYNGRFSDTRPVMDVAKQKGIPFRCNEVVSSSVDGENFKRIVYENNLPHNYPYNTELIKKLWNMDNEPVEEKRKKGATFFEKRRHGEATGDLLVPNHKQGYIDAQVQGKLPPDWDPNKRNFAIFNSSEDEYAALGRDFEQYSLFPSQLAGIRYLLANTKDENIHYYLRVHPNMRQIMHPYHLDLYKLESEFKNITVLPAASDYSTYDIMAAAEKVIVFGSTMGAESAYWHKPVIALSGSFYYFLDICHIPHSKEELNRLIEAKLAPTENRDNVLMFGYYCMHKDELSPAWKYYPDGKTALDSAPLRWIISPFPHSRKSFLRSLILGIIKLGKHQDLAVKPYETK